MEVLTEQEAVEDARRRVLGIRKAIGSLDHELSKEEPLIRACLCAASGRPHPKQQAVSRHRTDKLYKPEREDVAIPSLYAIVAASLLTGGRPAEVRGLAVSDVSFERKTITSRVHPWRRLKTLGSARVVRLWPQLESILREYLDGPNAPKGQLLFPSAHRQLAFRRRFDREWVDLFPFEFVNTAI